jgi:DNA mismatch repair ATPase MutS
LYETPLSSTGAKKILRHIFRNPTYNEHIIETRLDIITWLKKFNYDNKTLLKLFHNIHAIDIILNKINESRA